MFGRGGILCRPLPVSRQLLSAVYRHAGRAAERSAARVVVRSDGKGIGTGSGRRSVTGVCAENNKLNQTDGLRRLPNGLIFIFIFLKERD